MMGNKWFKMTAKKSITEIDIFDEIGIWGISAADFKDELKEKDNGKPIRVSINSPGGSVFDGIAIYALLADRRERVSVEIYGIAASIASVIALAGHEMVMKDGSFFMIHDPWSIAIGTAEEFRHEAEILDKISLQIMDIYRQHTALTDEELHQAMKDETWYTAEEAVLVGFAHHVEGQKAAAMAQFDMFKRFRNVPVGDVKNNQVANDLIKPEENSKMDDEKTAVKDVQAGGQPEAKDARFDELKPVVEANAKTLEDIKAKLESITVRPNLSPSFRDEDVQWFYDLLRETSENHGNLSGDFKAAADTITTSDGMGIPVAASEKILMNVNQMSILRRFGADVRPAGAQSTRFSTVVDSGAAGLITEGGSYAEKADPTLITMALYKLGGRFSLTEETDEDSFMDLYEAFQLYAARLIARAENSYFVSGSGSSQPKGLDEETTSETAAATGAVTFAELLALDEDLSPEWDFYLGDPGGKDYKGPVYLMSTSTAAALRALVDTNDNYYFRQHEDGRLTHMFGRPVVRTSNMADMEASAVAIALVNPMAYLIGERRPNLALKVGYDNNTHNVTWDFNERVGGQIWDTNGVALLTMAAS